MALTRNNHFVPQLYLKNFANDSGEVCEYRVLVPHSNVQMWKPVNVAGTGYEKNLYTRIVQGEEVDDIEKWLGCEFESPAQQPLQKVLADEELTRDDWKILVRFLASQIVRTPAFLIKNLPIWNRMAPDVLEQAQKDVEARLRKPKESGKRIIKDVPHREYFPFKIDVKVLPEENKVLVTRKLLVGRGLWYCTMKHTLTDTLKFLHRHKWTILEAPARLPWFTSDDPVICLNYRTESDYDFNGGWGRDRGNILSPISPRHLMFTEIGANNYPRRVPKRYHARLIRRMIAEHAHRRIYALNEDGKIPQLKPRVVYTEAYNNEREISALWYENQCRAEQAL